VEVLRVDTLVDDLDVLDDVPNLDHNRMGVLDWLRVQARIHNKIDKVVIRDPENDIVLVGILTDGHPSVQELLRVPVLPVFWVHRFVEGRLSLFTARVIGVLVTQVRISRIFIVNSHL
jgi:uncharacterized membrane-anchored protein